MYKKGKMVKNIKKNPIFKNIRAKIYITPPIHLLITDFIISQIKSKNIDILRINHILIIYAMRLWRSKQEYFVNYGMCFP
jgi:hypothetical protein